MFLPPTTTPSILCKPELAPATDMIKHGLEDVDPKEENL